jgi:uncharacterized protein YifE (UPF0438 family)
LWLLFVDEAIERHGEAMEEIHRGKREAKERE